jgi:hypothetical protein
LFECAEEAVVVAVGDLAAYGMARQMAIERTAPLLLTERQGDIDDELERLQPTRVRWVRTGDTTPRVDPWVAPTAPAMLMVTEVGDPTAGLIAEVAAALTGGAVLTTRPDDLRASAELAEAVGGSDVPVVLLGGFPEDAGWQLEVLREGNHLPGGGFLVFQDRRLVAYYGNPLTPNLGVLGHQGPEETVERLLPVAAPYGADGRRVLPTFEIIATVASAKAGGDGDYSDLTSVEDIRPWVDLARERGLYVVLDLQPGRTDFLTQARLYEELLTEPHVGLALDPEWRLAPDQVHLRQVGTVHSDEINTVARWLAELVRRHRLPQKLLVIQQFKLSMIQAREAIETPPELAVLIQMDGQGPLPTKHGTYDAITAGAEDAAWSWGWKNFYDLDTPLATPEEVLALEPVPVFVSFQ